MSTKKQNFNCLNCGEDLISDGFYCSMDCKIDELETKSTEIEDAYIELWKAVEDGELEKNVNRFFELRSKFRKLIQN